MGRQTNQKEDGRAGQTARSSADDFLTRNGIFLSLICVIYFEHSQFQRIDKHGIEHFTG